MVTIALHIKEGQSFMVVLEQTVGLPIDMVSVETLDDMSRKLCAIIIREPKAVHGILIHGPFAAVIYEDFFIREEFCMLGLFVSFNMATFNDNV